MHRLDPSIENKLYEQGIDSLSVQELMSLIIGKSSASEDCYHVSERLIAEYGSKTALNMNVKELKEQGVTTGAALRIVCAAELGKRFYEKNSNKILIRGPEDVYAYCNDMSRLNKEHFRVLCLNTKNYVIHDETVSIGHLSGALVHPREVFQPAVLNSASSIIIVHNHPSGDPEPSKSDDKITQMLKEAGNIMNIPLTDHCIIGEESYYSYNDKMKL